MDTLPSVEQSHTCANLTVRHIGNRVCVMRGAAACVVAVPALSLSLLPPPCARSLPPPAVGTGGLEGVLRPIHHPERIEPGGYGGVTGAPARRSYPVHFRPSRARPRRLPEGSIHHWGRGYGGGVGRGTAGCGAVGRTPEKGMGR